MRREAARDDVEQRGLARAVGADQAHHLAAADREGDAVERGEAAEVAAEAGDLEQGQGERRITAASALWLAARRSAARVAWRRAVSAPLAAASGRGCGRAAPRSARQRVPSRSARLLRAERGAAGAQQADQAVRDEEHDAEQHQAQHDAEVARARSRTGSPRSAPAASTPSIGPHTEVAPPSSAMMTVRNEVLGLKATVASM